MNVKKTAFAVAAGTLFSVAAHAQSAATPVQRDINQQQRIEQGLKSGELDTREASRLEREESRVEHMESKALRDGQVSSQEAARIERAQDKVSRDIYREKHDTQTGNPNSPSSQRMQADVQRNINEQQRIGQGLQSGQLTNREAGRLEAGQGRSNRLEARAGADGHVGPMEQQRIRRQENRQSRHIYRQKHDRQHRS